MSGGIGGIKVSIEADKVLGLSRLADLLGSQEPHGASWSDPEDPLIKAWVDSGIKRMRGPSFFDGTHDPKDTIKVTREPGGKIQLDFARFDSQLSKFVNWLGLSFTVFNIGVTPPALSSNPTANQPDPQRPEAGDYHWQYAPADYREWEDVIQRCVSHLVQQWRLQGMTYEILNEPEQTHDYWKGKPGSKDTLKDYVDLYVSTYKAIKRADPQAKLGSPVTAHFDSSRFSDKVPFVLTDFVNAIRDYNATHRSAPVAIDALVWHDYAWGSNRLSDGIDFAEKLAEATGIPSAIFPVRPEYLITEWGLDFTKEIPQEQRASHLAYNIIREAAPKRRRLAELHFYALSLGEYESHGVGMVISSKKGVIKRPSYAVTQLLKTMTVGHYLQTTTEEPLVALSTLHGRSNIVTVVNNHTADFQKATIQWNQLPYPEGKATLLMQRIDKSHSQNGKGLEKGKEIKVNIKNGGFSLSLTLVPYSTVGLMLREAY
jgi:hypothetical protein